MKPFFKSNDDEMSLTDENGMKLNENIMYDEQSDVQSFMW